MNAVGAKHVIPQNGSETQTVNDFNAAAPGPGLHERIKSLHQYLLAGLLAALLALAFVFIVGEVREGDTAGFDGVVLRQAQSLRAGHPGFVSAMRDLSGLGSTVVLTVFVTLGVGYVILVSAPTTAILVAVSTGSATVLVSAFKSAFSRLRPVLGSQRLVHLGEASPAEAFYQRLDEPQYSTLCSRTKPN